MLMFTSIVIFIDLFNLTGDLTETQCLIYKKELFQASMVKL